ncbi:putative endo-exoxylanase [Lineolata rhizophorae]|uniref:Putative endo-exoxylanase n=1 Tax=Lineolata rhizophorae TaxID=578093 RepID=A0A6A6P8U7_9PEZI|nr:putative endo-exoxylanase [Lineolata rhizophorae]
MRLIGTFGAVLAPLTSTQITVELSQTYQTMDGFGFSEAFQRSNQLHELPEDSRQYALDLLFNTTSGAGMTILRNGIGSSPDSRSDWMATIAPQNPGGPNAELQYVWDGDDNSQVWLSKKALEYGVTTIYANAWSAPGYMKTNGNDANGGSLCGVSGAYCQSGDWRQSYADYLVQYIKFYQQEGIQITHVGFLNEPELSTSYASMLSSGTQAADFIKVLSPTLEAAGLSETVGINCCDAEGWNHQGQMTNEIRNAGAEDLLSVVTSHSYTSQPSNPINTPHRVWQTEYADLQGAWDENWYGWGGAGEGMTWANRIFDAITGANASGYLYWIGVQGGDTNSKLIRISNGSVSPSKRLWAFAQFSRFIRPGAVRVGISGGGWNMKTSAFLNLDGSVSVQVINSGGATSLSIKVGDMTGSTVTAWLTDNSHDLDQIDAEIGSDGTVSGNVPGQSMVTFVTSS